MKPIQNTLVKFDFESLPVEYHSQYPFTKSDVFIFFGEISNMPGHCIICNHKTGQIYSGYDIENFIELTKDEV